MWNVPKLRQRTCRTNPEKRTSFSISKMQDRAEWSQQEVGKVKKLSPSLRSFHMSRFDTISFQVFRNWERCWKVNIFHLIPKLMLLDTLRSKINQKQVEKKVRRSERIRSNKWRLRCKILKIMKKKNKFIFIPRSLFYLV